jgi:SiaC family regulatory phosphoprotein
MIMNDLNITATQSTPSAVANWAEGALEMHGDSYPENSFEFFSPIVAWVEEYLAVPESPLRLELHLLYLNTSSVKAMMDIFDMLEEAHRNGRQVAVNWYYDSENERIAELAEEFGEDCTFPFEIVRLDRRPGGDTYVG